MENTRLVKKPQPPPDPRSKVNAPDNPISRLINGQRVSLLMRNGAIISGQIKQYKAGLINLDTVEAVNTMGTYSFPWMLVDRSMVVTIAPEPEASGDN